MTQESSTVSFQSVFILTRGSKIWLSLKRKIIFDSHSPRGGLQFSWICIAVAILKLSWLDAAADGGRGWTWVWRTSPVHVRPGRGRRGCRSPRQLRLPSSCAVLPTFLILLLAKGEEREIQWGRKRKVRKESFSGCQWERECEKAMKQELKSHFGFSGVSTCFFPKWS